MDKIKNEVTKEVKGLTKEDYLKAYQITTKALKYLQDKTIVKEEYLQMRLNVFTMLAGEKDVE